MEEVGFKAIGPQSKTRPLLLAGPLWRLQALFFVREDSTFVQNELVVYCRWNPLPLLFPSGQPDCMLGQLEMLSWNQAAGNAYGTRNDSVWCPSDLRDSAG